MAKKLYRYEITVTLSVRAESRAEAYEVAKLAKMELPEALAREHYLFGTCKMTWTLELMTGALQSSDTGRRVDMTTTFDRPAPMQFQLPTNTFD